MKRCNACVDEKVEPKKFRENPSLYKILMHVLEKHSESPLIEEFEDKASIEHPCIDCKERFLADIEVEIDERGIEHQLKINPVCDECKDDNPIRDRLMRERAKINSVTVSLLQSKSEELQPLGTAVKGGEP